MTKARLELHIKQIAHLNDKIMTYEATGNQAMAEAMRRLAARSVGDWQSALQDANAFANVNAASGHHVAAG